MWGHEHFGHGFWWHEGFWSGSWWVVPIVMIALCLFMMGGMTRWGWKGRMPRWRSLCDTHCDSALEILNRRYARGEIDKNEYEEKKMAITRTGP